MDSKEASEICQKSSWHDRNVLYFDRVMGYTCLCKCQNSLKCTYHLMYTHVVVDPVAQLGRWGGIAPPAIMGSSLSFSEF